VSIGVPEEKICVTADPAFRLTLGEKVDVTELKREIGMKNGGRYFAVSLRAATCTGQKGREICRACRDIFLNLGLTPVFVSMQECEDRELCRFIAEDTCGEALIVPHQPPEVLCSLIGDMEFVLSMRLHLIIYAAAAGTPAIGVSVDPKLDAMVGVLGSAELIRDEDFTAEKFLAAAKRALALDRDDLLRISKEQAVMAAKDARAAVRMILDGENDRRDA